MISFLSCRGTNPDYEQFFGVADADGNLKYQGMSNGYC
jgi:hypothetical protein